MATKAKTKEVALPRNLVVCCDGTSNEIGKQLSNVFKLYRVLNKGAEQIAYYNPGIGTVRMPNAWGKWRQTFRAGFEMATGKGLDRDVLDAYCFLCRHYRPGDRIYLFGFSRGAYTARVVAGMIYLIGLLREHQVNFAGYALRAYKGSKEADDFELAKSFSRSVTGQCVPIHFLGLWDTVASVIVPGGQLLSGLELERLPYTASNPGVKVFRQAIAIDEFRRLFRIERWEEPQAFKYNPFSQAKSFPDQDIKQVWFAGCHSDVGGGFIEEASALAKFPLKWMIAEARTHHLAVRTQMVNHLVLGGERIGARAYTKPDAKGPLHISLSASWKSLEWFPKSVRYKDWPKRATLFGLYIPWGEPRRIPDDSLIHQSVIRRMGAKIGYSPVNLPEKRRVEPDVGVPAASSDKSKRG